MQIWVDADACPNPIKQILFRAAQRTATTVTLVANHALRIPASQYIKTLQVTSGFDIADNEIIKRVTEGDLVVTADIPLASEVIDKGGLALNPRGELYTSDTIRQRLAMRDFMDNLRSSGINTGGPAAMSQSDKHKFANTLDKLLAQRSN
jgi:hypothetical protein